MRQFTIIKKLSVLAEIIVVASCLLVFALTIPVTKLGGMEPESARMCFHMISWITVVKPIVWTLAFIPAYGLRAAGDVKFSMITSCITMWTFRFCLCCISDPFQTASAQWLYGLECLLTGQCGESYFLFASTVGNG